MNNNKTKTTVRLFGTIGSDINGDKFASDLASLDGKFESIDLHINSPGGNVSQGYSIVSVILSMKTPVDVYVVGIAASMAAVIAISGNNVYMYDYSRLMIHDPFFAGKDDSKLSNKDKNTLLNITTSLRTILARRGKSTKEIGVLMKNETWFSAEEAKESGLIDNVISTARKNEFKNLSSSMIFSRISAEYKTSNNYSTLKNMDLLQQLASILGLENPTEEQIVQAVQELVNKRNAPEGVRERLDNALKRGVIDQASYSSLLGMGSSSPEAFTSYLDKLNEEHEQKLEAEINDYFEQIKPKLYYVKFEDKQLLRDFAKRDFEMFVRLTSALPDRKALSAEIKDMAALRKGGKHAWTLDDYRKYAPGELKNNPELYERLISKEKSRNNITNH